MSYQGCLLLVSHDRYFMDKCVDSLFILEEDGNVSGFVGKCSEYIELREEMKKGGEVSPSLQPAKQSSANPSSGATSSGSSPATPQQPAKTKLSYNEKREFEALDAEIPQLEAEQKSLEEKMSSSDFEEAKKAGDRYNEIARLLEEKYARWEELSEFVK